MGRLKIKDWQYKSSPDKKCVDPALASAIQLASYQYKTQKKVREMMAVDREVNQLCIDNQNYAIDEYMNWDYGCVALVLHRRYGYDAAECAAFLDDMQNLVREFEGSDYYSNEIWDVVRDEVGLDVVIGGKEVNDES